MCFNIHHGCHQLQLPMSLGRGSCRPESGSSCRRKKALITPQVLAPWHGHSRQSDLFQNLMMAPNPGICSKMLMQEQLVTAQQKLKVHINRSTKHVSVKASISISSSCWPQSSRSKHPQKAPCRGCYSGSDGPFH